LLECRFLLAKGIELPLRILLRRRDSASWDLLLLSRELMVSRFPDNGQISP
jgi:hypothetical protein